MYRTLLGASSALAILAMAGILPTTVYAHDDGRLCNVILDGDGEPVREADDDEIAHGNSSACPDSAKAEEDGLKSEAEETAVAGVEPTPDPEAIVEPLVVYFDVNRDDLDAGARAEVAAYVKELMATSPTSVDVVGYTDTSGSADLNARLSEARASSVSAALIEGGLPSGMISRGAAGEGDLAVDTPDGTREASNRRVAVTPIY